MIVIIIALFTVLLNFLLYGSGPVLLTYYFTKECKDEDCNKIKNNVLIAGIVLCIAIFIIMIASNILL